jgi:hypothetical protein
LALIFWAMLAVWGVVTVTVREGLAALGAAGAWPCAWMLVKKVSPQSRPMVRYGLVIVTHPKSRLVSLRPVPVVAWVLSF